MRVDGINNRGRPKKRLVNVITNNLSNLNITGDITLLRQEAQLD